MMLLEKASENAGAIRLLGLSAVRDAREAGVPAYYLDATLGDGIIREMPDGTRQRLEIRDGEDVVVESFGPRG